MMVYRNHCTQQVSPGAVSRREMLRYSTERLFLFLSDSKDRRLPDPETFFDRIAPSHYVLTLTNQLSREKEEGRRSTRPVPRKI
jgi:hypothetical protein